MTIDTNTMISISEANQNFSKVARYLVIDFSKADEDVIASDENVLSISKKLMAHNQEKTEQRTDPYAPFSAYSTNRWK